MESQSLFPDWISQDPIIWCTPTMDSMEDVTASRRDNNIILGHLHHAILKKAKLDYHWEFCGCAAINPDYICDNQMGEMCRDNMKSPEMKHHFKQRAYNTFDLEKMRSYLNKLQGILSFDFGCVDLRTVIFLTSPKKNEAIENILKYL